MTRPHLDHPMPFTMGCRLARFGSGLGIESLLLATCVLMLASRAVAQSPAVAESDAAEIRQAVLAPQHLELLTKDQVILHCDYFPGTHGKETVPVILLHGWEGPRGVGEGQDVQRLARELQKVGHAVAVPDLRGHGRSTTRLVNQDDTVAIRRDRMRTEDFHAMIMDVEAVRSFLVDENNAGRLNIELLCVVGFDMGTVAALNWIHYDWTVPSWPTFKQGQDVKAFVLVSPEQSFRGTTTRNALANPVVRGSLSAMIIYGIDDPDHASGRRIYNTLKRSHRPISEDSKESEEMRDLFLVELDTSLRGTKLLAIETLDLTDSILEFIQRRLVDRQQLFPWRDRTR